jgi:hypothetical protein
MRLNQPIVGGVSTPSGRGYWFVAADGGVFSFGDARFHGSTGAMHLTQPICRHGIRNRRAGLPPALGERCGCTGFGSAKYYGSADRACQSVPAVAIATARYSSGYWIAFANAQAYALSPVKSAPTCGPNAVSKTSAAAADLFTRMNDERAPAGFPRCGGTRSWPPTPRAGAGPWRRAACTTATSGAC